MPISEGKNIDCMEFMPLFPDKFFNIGFPDPPYGLNQTIDKVKSRCRLATTSIRGKFEWDSKIPDVAYFQELFRVTANQIIWGANYFPFICGTPFKAPRRKEYCKFIEEHPANWIIWDKVNGNSDFSDCELAWTSFPVPTEVFYFMWAGMFQGKSITEGRTMQGKKSLNEKKVHPTQKPLPLYQFQLKKFAQPGDKLLDTHMGSQGSRIVAYKMGFDYWGSEIDERHFTDGENRFKEQITTPLFQIYQ